MSNEESFYKKAYLREKQARKQAEKILEDKSLELYNTNEQLKFLNNNLEVELVDRLKQKQIIEQEFSSFVNKATDIIYRLDPKGCFTFVNPMTELISGFTAEEIIGQSFTYFVHPDDKVEVESFYSEQIEMQQESTYFEYKIKSKEGRDIWLGQNVQIIYKEEGISGFIAIARNITERKQLEKSIIQSEEKYRGIIESLEFGILEVDTKGIITKAHSSFSTLTGYTQKELIGKNPYEFLHPDSYALMQLQEEKRKDKVADVYEVQIKKKTGEYIWVIISGAPFYDTEGNQTGSVGIHLDITERKKMEEDLKKANEKALASSKSKELFFAKVSHEIRTPLNAVVGLTDLLLKTDLNPTQKKYTYNINKSANNLLLLVNDILDITKIEKDQLSINNKPFKLKNFLNNIHATLDYQAQQKELPLLISVDKNIENHYISDELRLTQIIINLANNAIKFTSIGYVKILLELVSIKKNQHLIKFSVIDTGKGIAQDKIDKIFNEFTQESTNTFNTYGGSGLGLAISKKLVELLGGTIQVTSNLNKGSTFFFTLPFTIAEKKKKNTKKEETTVFTAKDWSATKILIVEDNPINQLVIQETLTIWKVQHKTVNNGLEAVEQIKQEEFDIVLMDMQMPVMDGITATKEIRQTLKSNVPIIAFTANAMKADIQKCLEVGMNDAITKPFKEEELKSKIQNLVSKNHIIKKSKNIKPLLHIDKLEELAHGNMAFVIKMLHIFNETSQQELKTLSETTDCNVISQIAHKIKPSIGYLSTLEMQELVLKIEFKEFVNNPELLDKFISMLKTLKKECKNHLDKHS
ncbi:PAS domain-containing hybrid sensor histidine kinase/response regulator [Wenyingzhuangia aestuarii]|uniref:PAS domain-containing hybrid sensor histidine kinase/response regulator n=1 Tax=Wenyingzhuangia aestuarii TaxID=1647582 RepID=UPI00143AA18E|nr:PAS domain-containing hybrid sensor histidine kinase/response regulator [Wenyingzhuangia aestuarii]NJB82456.1 PAS domain S-box-containing protein [Wenyingzhuangia aestuarii]